MLWLFSVAEASLTASVSADNVARVVTEAELAQIQERYRVRDRDWLEVKIEYEGRGEAEFSSNPGTSRGPMKIRYGEDGAAEVFSMTVEELTADQHPGGPDGLFVFVNALPLPEGGGFGFGGSSNDCVRVELAGAHFAVRAAQRSDVMASAGNGTATFRPYRTIASFRSWAITLCRSRSARGRRPPASARRS
jgi:hypothetical protein